MRAKDVVYLVISAILFVFVGFWALTKYGHSKPQVPVEVVAPISSEFDAQGLSVVSDANQIRDFSIPIDLNGLGNQTPFGGR